MLGAHSQSDAMREAANRMNDHRLIAFQEKGRRGCFSQVIHAASAHYLRVELKKPFDGKRVIVSHHAPSLRSISPEYQTHILYGAFTSDLEAFIECY